jgi:hypothetical protein
MDITAEQIASALAGMPYPARLWQIVTWAEYNAASLMVMDTLHRLSERTYFRPQEIVDALMGQGAMEATLMCRHRRHPRECPWHGLEIGSIAS